ncbi:hypothetical protein U9M48_004643 [Paspalum notatum var. saurae]|uniref:DUF8040 domain-containing protein n=1 Tax=Paspalum notatum var. saurae TaxID=547442 RepID=A0AAQ3PP42_PASNO
MRSLGNRTYCYNNFRMHKNVFHHLHNVLVESYSLKSTKRMSSVESLALFLWMYGCPHEMRHAEDRFYRSKETCIRKFDEVLTFLNKLAADIIRPLDPEFTNVHPKLQSARFTPYFDNCIGAIDGTHVPVVVPSNQLVQHMGRKGFTGQNVLAICDFNMSATQPIVHPNPAAPFSQCRRASIREQSTGAAPPTPVRRRGGFSSLDLGPSRPSGVSAAIHAGLLCLSGRVSGRRIRRRAACATLGRGGWDRGDAPSDRPPYTRTHFVGFHDESPDTYSAPSPPLFRLFAKQIFY